MKCLKVAAYLLFVIAIIFICPIYFYVGLSEEYTTAIYWISFYYTAISLAFMIIESLITIIISVIKYCRKKRKFVWNSQLGRYQRICKKDIELINRYKQVTTDHKGNTLTNDQKTHDKGLIDKGTSREWEIVLTPPDPTVTVIITASLEKSRDYLYDTLLALSEIHCKPQNVKVLLVHNAPNIDNTNSNLMQRIRTIPFLKNGIHFTIMPCDSKNRAEALMYAASLIRSGSVEKTRYVALLDANQKLEKYSLVRALEKLNTRPVDVLQSRCVIGDTRSFLGWTIGIEYDLLHSMQHKGGEVLRCDNVLGGGGYWTSTEIFLELGFNPKMASDDIDFCLRAVMRGYKVVSSNNVIVYEPPAHNVATLWAQRVKWSKGWFQVARATFGSVFCSTASLAVRWFILRLILYHEILYYPSAQVLPILLSSLVEAAYEYNFYIFLGSCVSQLILPVQLIIVYTQLKLDVDRISPETYARSNIWKYCVYVLLSPFYGYFKFLAIIVGHVCDLIE